jgi:hypothetical protein
VRATSADGAVGVSTAVSWYKESESYPLTVNVRDAGGDPARPQTVIANRIDRLNPNDPFGRIQYSTGSSFDGGVATMRVTAGTYGLDVWTSTDGGKTWQRAVALPRGDGHYTAIVEHPQLADTDGFVSLRLSAKDAAGGTMTTTVEHAYALR